LVQNLGGNIKLKESIKGLTVFAFTIPVQESRAERENVKCAYRPVLFEDE